MDDSIEYLKGWHRNLIRDKALENESCDIEVINMPTFVNDKNLKLPVVQQQTNEEGEIIFSPVISPRKLDESCKTFVYATYLNPGLH